MEISEQAMLTFEIRVCQAEGRANAKSLREECAWYAGRMQKQLISLGQWFSKWRFPPSANRAVATSPGSLLEIKILRPTSVSTNQKLWRWGSQCVLTRLAEWFWTTNGDKVIGDEQGTDHVGPYGLLWGLWLLFWVVTSLWELLSTAVTLSIFGF